MRVPHQIFVMLNLFQHNAQTSLGILKQVQDDELGNQSHELWGVA